MNAPGVLLMIDWQQGLRDLSYEGVTFVLQGCRCPSPPPLPIRLRYGERDAPLMTHAHSLPLLACGERVGVRGSRRVRRYESIDASSAYARRDTVGAGIDAETIHRAHLASLHGEFARIAATDEIIADTADG